jgi:hypothetical protein
MTQPIFDISAVIAVESLFDGGDRDPWAAVLAGEFADLFIYGDQLRYPLPVPSYSSGTIEEPPLIKQLTARDPGIIAPLPYSTAEPRYLREEHFSTLVQRFRAWAKNNHNTFSQWLTFTRAIRRFYHYKGVFSFEDAQSTTAVETLAQDLGIFPEEMIYTLDLVARYPLYGLVAGDQFYLNHPIRNSIKIPSMQTEVVPITRPAIAFRDTITHMAHTLTFDSYTALLHELRGEIRERELHLLRPGEFEPAVVREIAVKVGLPPNLKQVGRVLGILTGVVGGLGAIATFAPAAAIGGAALAVSSAIWQGGLPAIAGKAKWLHWAVEWELEKQDNSPA